VLMLILVIIMLYVGSFTSLGNHVSKRCSADWKILRHQKRKLK